MTGTMETSVNKESHHLSDSLVAANNESLSDIAYRLMEHHIVTLKLSPGSVVNERSLINLTGMGRTPVREAIQRLAWEGLMEIRPRSGIAITPVDPLDFNKVLDARIGVEQVIARDAARFSGLIDHQNLYQAAEAMQQAAVRNDVEGFLDADKALDQVMGMAAANRYAVRLAAPLQTHSRRFWYQLRRDDGLSTSADAHIQLINAIVSGDQQIASACAQRLIDHLRTIAP